MVFLYVCWLSVLGHTCLVQVRGKQLGVELTVANPPNTDGIRAVLTPSNFQSLATDQLLPARCEQDRRIGQRASFDPEYLPTSDT